LKGDKIAPFYKKIETKLRQIKIKGPNWD